MRRSPATLVILALLGGACSAGATAGTATTSTATGSAALTAPETPPTTITTTTTLPAATTTTSPYARPDWLGTRLLPLRPDGFGEVEATPAELVDRRLETIDLLPPPAGEDFEFTISPVPEEVLVRSSWTPDCPVTVDELAYVTVSHFGFDRRFHTGEMLVNAAWAEQIVDVFRRLHDARFPIEQMRVIRAEEIDAHPTGDFNETTSFVCRPAVGSNSWSQHAYGTAVDINPFHNPYLKADLVLPELASAYTDRGDVRPGMIEPGDVVIDAFAAIGWKWGGDWRALKDWMHFSLSGG